MRRVLCSHTFLVFVLLWTTYAYFYPSGGHNEAVRMDTIRAFFEHGRFSIDEYVGNTADAIVYKDGHYYSSKAPGTFYLGILPYAVFQPFSKIVSNSNGVREHFVCYLVSVFSVALLTALSGALMFRFFLLKGEQEKTALAITLACFLGTLLFPFSTIFFSHAATAAVLWIGFYLWQTNSFQTPTRRSRWDLLVGLCLGFAMVLEYPAVIGAGLLFFWFNFQIGRGSKWIQRIPLAVGAAIGLLPLLLYNYMAFRNIFYIPYEAYNQSGSTFAAHSKGILGIRIPFLDAEYTKLFFQNLYSITLGPLRGLFRFNPVLIFIFPAIYLLFRGRRNPEGPHALHEGILALLLLAAYLIMNAGFGDTPAYWGGGYSFGPRHVIPALPFMAFLLLPVARKWPAVFWPMALMSVILCFIATAVDPHAPYAPDNILSEHYWPYVRNGHYAIATEGIFSKDLVTHDSVAFNWGKLMGLPGAWQFAPLLGIWILAALIYLAWNRLRRR